MDHDPSSIVLMQKGQILYLFVALKLEATINIHKPHSPQLTWQFAPKNQA